MTAWPRAANPIQRRAPVKKTAHRLRLMALIIGVAGMIPALAHADWNQANDEANRQRMMSEMRANAEAADRANEQSQRQQQQTYDNRARSSGGSSSGGASSSGGGGYTPYQHHDIGPASVVESYSFKVYKQETEAQTIARVSREAEAGQVQSQYNLARIYYAGYGATPRDDALARKWFAAAAQQGHAPAQAQYGAMLFNGRGGPADPASGLAYLKQAADRGEHYGEALYAFFSLSAASQIDADKRRPELVAMLERAADGGEVVAQNYLGRVVYLYGIGAPHDYVKVIKYLKMAVDQNDPSSMFDLGQYYCVGSNVEKDMTKGLTLIKRSVDLGFGDAEAFYGFGGYVQGQFGVTRDLESAVRLLKLSVQHNSAQGAYYLGLLSQDGLGVPKDMTAAAGYYRAAAEGKIADGQARYGLSMILGEGVAKNIPAGAAMIRLAADGDSSLGQEFLARLYVDGLGVPKDLHQAVVWFKKAAEQGDANAIEALKDPALANA